MSTRRAILVAKTTLQTLDVRMVAAAHVMHDVDEPFDAPLAIEPPGHPRKP
jgi:hypothetical protein